MAQASPRPGSTVPGTKKSPLVERREALPCASVSRRSGRYAAACYSAPFGAPLPLNLRGGKPKAHLARRRENAGAWLFEIRIAMFRFPGAMQRAALPRRDASLNRDRNGYRSLYGPGSAAHQAVRNGPLRCVRGTSGEDAPLLPPAIQLAIGCESISSLGKRNDQQACGYAARGSRLRLHHRRRRLGRLRARQSAQRIGGAFGAAARGGGPRQKNFGSCAGPGREKVQSGRPPLG